MDSGAKEFIETISKSIDINDRNVFWNIIGNTDVDPEKPYEYIVNHPETLLLKIRNHFVFDFFYEKVLGDRCHPTDSLKWQTNLLKVIELTDNISSDILKQNKKYLLRLQSGNRPLTNIFSALIKRSFEMGDPEFLVYSIIARGEMAKLEIMSKMYIIEDYPAVIDVALRFGRSKIIEFFKKELKVEFKYCGKILDFENYKDNPRYLYYKEHILYDVIPFRSQSIVGSVKQDYTESLNLILSDYYYPVTVTTLHKWCNLIEEKRKSNGWDVINAEFLLPIIINKIEEQISLTEDFGSFNTLVFGFEWSDRKCLVEHCLNLQKKLDMAQERSSIIEDRYKALQYQYEKLSAVVNCKYRAIGHRVRRETN